MSKFINKVLTIPDEEYRQIPAFSYSLLKSLDDDGPRAISNPKKLSGEALVFGSLVDMMLTAPEHLDEKFYNHPITAPTASLLQLADALLLDAIVMDLPYEEITDDDVIVNKIGALKLWTNIVDTTKLKAKYDTDIFWDYIRESIAAKGKIIISQETLDAATHCANVLLTHEFTKEFFTEREGIEILKQASILYTFKGIKGKARIDLLVIDHNTKTIHVFDIKTGAELPSKFEISFYKYKYYLQVISYLLAVQSVCETNEEFKDYKIDTFKFLYISKKLSDVPVIWNVPEKLLNNFMDGWDDNTGFEELMRNYQYVVETGNYNCERKVMENNGKLTITLK